MCSGNHLSLCAYLSLGNYLFLYDNICWRDRNDMEPDKIVKMEAIMETLVKDVESLKIDAKIFRGCLYVQLKEMKDDCTVIFVSQDRFRPIERLSYLVVGSILLTVVGWILTMVIRK